MHRLEKITDVHTLDRTRRSLEQFVILASKCDDRPVATLAHAGRDQSDNALVPVGVVHAHARRPALRAEGIHVRECLVAHGRLDVTALAVDPVEHLRLLRRDIRFVRQQALDTDRDILKPPRRVDPRAHGKTEIGTDAPRQLSP